MEKVDVVIIGAGVVGLAIAYELSRKRQVDMVLLEKHPYCGAETSSRNSEVIHAGMYYPGGTLKARFCVQGNRQLYELCEKQRIPYRKCGKIIVASNAEEMKKVDELFQQGKANGAPGLTMLDARQIQAMEPEVRAREALFSPETGLIDAHRLIQYYETQAQANGVLIAYNSEVVGLEKLSDGYRITVSDESGGSYDLQGALVINCAGLYADKVAALAGIDIAQYQYRIHFCKGEYFNVSNRHAGKFQRLVYPVPTAYSLGIHTRLRLDGTVALGPNAIYVDTVNYEVDAAHQADFFNSIREIVPCIEYDDLSPEMAGIRPKLQGPGDKFRDFVISEESDKGFPGLINLIGIDSPGLTSAPAIAEYVCGLL